MTTAIEDGHYREAHAELLDDPVIQQMAMELAASGQPRSVFADSDGHAKHEFMLLASRQYYRLCEHYQRKPVACHVGGPAAAVLELAYPSPPVDPYPEHTKLAAVKPSTEIVGEFLEWMRSRGWVLACPNVGDELVPVGLSDDRVLALWAGVDLAVLEREQRAMLAAHRRELDAATGDIQAATAAAVRPPDVPGPDSGSAGDSAGDSAGAGAGESADSAGPGEALDA